MSVINTVLKDLDNKPSAFTPLDVAVAGIQKKKSRINVKFWMLGFIFLVVLVVSAYFINPYFSYQRGQQAKVSAVTSEAVKLPSEISAEIEAPEILSTVHGEITTTKKVEITGLQLNENDHFMELSLQLPLGAQSFLKRRDKNSYIFLISNANKKIITPQIENNLWIKSVAVNELKENLEIQFVTPDNILVETRHAEKEGVYNWVIRLKKSTPLKNSETLIAPNKKAEILPLPGVEEGSLSRVDLEKTKPESKPLKMVKFDIKPVKHVLTDTQLLAQSTSLIKQREWVKAQSELQKLLGTNVDKKARIKLLGVFQVQQEKNMFNQLLLESLELYPEASSLLVLHARQLFTQKEFLSLINQYGSKDIKQVLNLVAASYQSIKQHDKAISYYQKSLTMDSLQPRSWVSLAISQEQLSRFNLALESYQMALRSGRLNKRLQDFTVKRIQQLTNKTQ